MTENVIVGELTKGFIYEIRCNITNKCYYGATTSLYRKYNHMHKNSTSSKEIIDAGDWNMKTLETIFYRDKSELLLRERWYIENNECINKNLPIITKEEKEEYRSEAMRKWYIKNRVKHIQSCSKYNSENVDKHKRAMQKYQETHREQIRNYQRAYRQKIFDEAVKKINENIVLAL